MTKSIVHHSCQRKCSFLTPVMNLILYTILILWRAFRESSPWLLDTAVCYVEARVYTLLHISLSMVKFKPDVYHVLPIASLLSCFTKIRGLCACIRKFGLPQYWLWLMKSKTVTWPSWNKPFLKLYAPLMSEARDSCTTVRRHLDCLSHIVHCSYANEAPCRRAVGQARATDSVGDVSHLYHWSRCHGNGTAGVVYHTLHSPIVLCPVICVCPV